MADTMSSESSNLDKFRNQGEAWFKLVFGALYMTIVFACLVVFFRSRHVFEIRARSAYLVTFLGLVLLIQQALNIDLDVIVLFDAPRNYFRNSLAVCFYLFTITSVYICRVLRLVVGFSPKIRRAVPWLMSERLLIIGSATVGLVSLSIPLYCRYTITEDPWEEEYFDAQSDNIWICSLALQAIQVPLIPIVWLIDDLFHISAELIVIIVLGLVKSVIDRLVTEEVLPTSVQNWINAANVNFLVSCILLGLSIIDPVRRLVFSPMARTSPAMARAYERSRNTNAKSTRSMTPDSDGGPATGRTIGSLWNYEKIAGIPEMAAAFKNFANRALCQESVWFLEDVANRGQDDFFAGCTRIATIFRLHANTMYRKGDYEIAESQGETQVAAFEAITRRFIVDGAPDEINVSSRYKKGIMQLFNTSTDTFDPLDEQQLRVVFDQAYDDVRFTLESNILSRFMETEDFAKAAKERPFIRKRSFCFP